MTKEELNTELPILERQVYKSEGGTITIFEATYNGEPCYSIEHVPTGHKELISYNPQILTQIIKKMGRVGSLSIRKTRSGNIGLKFQSTRREKGISLRLYVYSKYKDIPPQKMRQKTIKLYNDSLLEYGIIDLRESNIYDSCTFLPTNECRNIEIISVCGQEFIRISIGQAPLVEYVDYSPELYTVLSTPYLCKYFCLRNNRIGVSIRYKQRYGKRKMMTLSRFAYLYANNFGRYAQLKGSIIRFLGDIPRLTQELKKEVDHVNSNKTISCYNNLLSMDSKLNRQKYDFFKDFQLGDVGVFAVTNAKKEVLIEYRSAAGINEYFKCITPKDFVDWILVHLGRSEITKNLRVAYQGEETGVTLAEKYKCPKDAELSNISFTEWVICKNRLLSMGDDVFTVYSSNSARVLNIVALPEEADKTIYQHLPEGSTILGHSMPKGTIVAVTQLKKDV